MEPLLTPFPRPNHLALLRQEKERRRRRRWTIGAALAVGLTAASGTVAAAASELAPVPRAAESLAAAADDPRTVDAADAVIAAAEEAVDGAHASVDTTALIADMRTAGAYAKLPVASVLAAAESAEAETAEVVAATEAAEKADAERAAAEKAAAEKAAAEKAAAEQAAAEQAAAEQAAQEAAEQAAQEAPAEEQPVEVPAPAAATASAAEAQEIAREMASSQYGWGDDEFSCLVALWNKESGWNASAYNASSGAYGIPQALPGSKMGSVAADWQTNAATQIAWGLGYIAGTYGTPCGAWSHSESVGWY